MHFFSKSSDVLQDMRVNVYEEGSENVIWYKVILLTKARDTHDLQRTHLYLLYRKGSLETMRLLKILL